MHYGIREGYITTMNVHAQRATKHTMALEPSCERLSSVEPRKLRAWIYACHVRLQAIFDV